MEIPWRFLVICALLVASVDAEKSKVKKNTCDKSLKNYIYVASNFRKVIVGNLTNLGATSKKIHSTNVFYEFAETDKKMSYVERFFFMLPNLEILEIYYNTNRGFRNQTLYRTFSVEASYQEKPKRVMKPYKELPFPVTVNWYDILRGNVFNGSVVMEPGNLDYKTMEFTARPKDSKKKIVPRYVPNTRYDTKTGKMHHRDLEKPVNESLEVIFDGIALIRDAQKNLYIQKDPDVCSSSVKNSANFSFVNFFHNYTIIPVEPEPEEEGPCTNKDKSGLKSPLLTIVMVILSSVVLFVFYAVIISCRAKKFQRMSEAKRKALELAKRGWLNMMEQSSTANDVSQVSRATQVSQISQVSQVTNDETEASRVQPVSQVSQVSQVSRSDGPDSQVSQVSRAGGVSQISQVSGVSQVSQAGGGDDDDEKSRVPTMAKKKGKADKQTALKPKDRTLATFEDF